jgi:hypothetical protein
MLMINKYLGFGGSQIRKKRSFIELDFFKPGGLDLSRRPKSISLDVMDNLDGFQKLVSTIEKSRFSLDELSQDRTFWSRSRLIEIYRDFCDY